jgi:hypothetical protein
LHGKDNYNAADTPVSDIRADEFPQLNQIQTEQPLRATLIIEMPEREIGFYWVKMEQGADWVLAKWSGQWWLPGNGLGFQDREFAEIDENRIKRAQK